MDERERQQAADALEAVLGEAENGELLVTDKQRAYLLGAIQTLRALGSAEGA